MIILHGKKWEIILAPELRNVVSAREFSARLANAFRISE
jgi:hypothetical protein